MCGASPSSANAAKRTGGTYMAASDDQSTPQEFWEKLNDRYHFILDAAANQHNHKCDRYYGDGGECPDALAVEWPTDGWIWCNPPYSRGNQLRFVEKAAETAKRGGAVVMLLPADTGTKLFHDHILGRHDVTFVRGRLRFNGVKGSPRFASMLVEFTHR